MAQPSSSHHRERERSHHHHRTISSTTLLLVLSLILAVLAVMLSLPSAKNSNAEGGSSSVWGYLSPKRSQALVAREHAVALREAEVARREADVLAGSPGGVSLASCSCPTPSSSTGSSIATEILIAPPPIQTVIKEVLREVDVGGPPGWWKDAGVRVEELLDRETRVSDREKEVGKREESIGRRETDVSRRETWIMEQLIALGNEQSQTIEEEVIYEAPRRKVKELPPLMETMFQTVTQVLPPLTETLTETVTVPPAANTRVAARPAPEEHIPKGPIIEDFRPTTAVEIVKESISVSPPQIIEEDIEILDAPEDYRRTVTVVQRPRQTRRWFS